VNAAPAAMVAHALSGSFHTGLLDWSKVDTAGSNLTDITTRLHVDLQGMTPNDHHDHVHPLIGTDSDGVMQHTATGLTNGWVVRANGPTAFAWGQLRHTEIDPTSILPDQHHPFMHDIIANVPGFGTAHTVTGADFTVVGVHPADTLALLPTSSAPGAAVSILKTDANGAIQLDTNLLYVDGANNWIGINRTPSGATLDVIASANADHTQRIKQKSGQTGRMWRIEDLSGNELIVLDSVGNLQSGRPGFVSGLTGWQITPQGNAEFNNIWARGELHATVFVKDEIHATGGTFMVATAGVLHDDAQIDSSTVDDDVLVVYSTPAGAGVPLQVVTTSGTFTGNELHVIGIRNIINVNDPPSGPGFYFQPGDIIRSKTEVPTGVTDFWLEINSAVQNSGYSSYSVFKRSGTDGTLPKGAALVSYGREGDGRILMTSDLNYAPYIDVFTTGPNVWTGDAGAIVPRMRMGRLDGIGLPGVSGVTQYGMIAGKDLSDANSGYLIASNLQFSLYKINIRLNNGTNDTGLWTPDGNLFLGTNIGGDPVNSPNLTTTGFRVYTTGGLGASPGDVIIGNEATDNYLKWSQVSGVLTVHGQLLVGGGGGAVTSTYVDAKDVEYDAKANLSPTGYAGIAQAAAQVYGDARRIVGVAGSWDSTGATTIRWGTKAAGAVALTATFGNNSTRTIADHAAASVTVSTRTYLFVNTSGSGTMTMLTTTNASLVAASANNVLIAVVDPGDSLTKRCSITVVAGSTFMSGSNIFTGSIVAANIATGTITANEILGGTLTMTEMAPDVSTAMTAAGSSGRDQAQTYGDARRVTGVSGTWTVIDGDTISWTGVSVKFANGSARAIAASGGNYTFSSTGRWYLFVDMGAGSLTMVGGGSPSTSINAVPLNGVLIAVVDTYATGKASINIVAGSTYISGGNIVAQSIRSTEIVANTLTLGNMAPDVTGAITDAQTAGDDAALAASDNKIYADQRRLINVGGSFVGVNGNTVSWGSPTPLQANFANGSVRTITAQTNVGLSPAGRWYFYVNVGSGSGTLAMQTPTRTLGALGVNDVLIAVVDTSTLGPTPVASISIVGGSTYISGGNIMTGSIVTSNLAATQITADKLQVNDLSAIGGSGAVNTGSLAVDGSLSMNTTGKFYSGTKTTFNKTPVEAGFFLGWDTGAGTSAYKFKVGDITKAEFSWDGNSMAVSGSQPLVINNLSNGVVLDMRGPAGQSGTLSMLATGRLTSSRDTEAPQVWANKFIQTGTTLQIQASRTITSITNPPDGGLAGEICWDGQYLYLCVATNTWRRIPLFYTVNPAAWWA
jgi:hypothetical protein